MDLEEIRKSKADLEEQITLLCREFEHSTGLAVAEIKPPEVIRVDRFGVMERKSVLGYHAKVTLEAIE